jgi:hypothetical protein
MKNKDNYELHSRMDSIEKAYPDPGPEIWPKGARVIKTWCPDDADEMLAMCGITPEGTPV